MFPYVINPVMKAILHSPLHGLVSDQLILLTFAGRKTGNRYTIPVGYKREGDTLQVTTESPWWKNMRDGASVTVRLKGERRPAYAEAITDTEAVAKVIHADLEEHGVERARRRYRLDIDHLPSIEELSQLVEGKVVIRIELD